MAKARTYGSGWHRQSVRHSNARKTGRAGGRYASMTYKGLRRAGVNLHPLRDTDGDGIRNYKDCRPLNKKRQDDKIKPRIVKIKAEDKKEAKWMVLARIGKGDWEDTHKYKFISVKELRRPKYKNFDLIKHGLYEVKIKRKTPEEIKKVLLKRGF
jgi:hypothetical protein